MDKLDVAIDSLRAQVDSAAPVDEDTRMRSVVVTRIALLKGPRLRAICDAVCGLAPDEELDRILRKSA